MVLSHHLIPKLFGILPEGDVPYTRNDAPEGTEHQSLAYESRKFIIY